VWVTPGLDVSSMCTTSKKEIERRKGTRGGLTVRSSPATRAIPEEGREKERDQHLGQNMQGS